MIEAAFDQAITEPAPIVGVKDAAPRSGDLGPVATAGTAT
jgi:hypothetical protein